MLCPMQASSRNLPAITRSASALGVTAAEPATTAITEHLPAPYHAARDPFSGCGEALRSSRRHGDDRTGVRVSRARGSPDADAARAQRAAFGEAIALAALPAPGRIDEVDALAADTQVSRAARRGAGAAVRGVGVVIARRAAGGGGSALGEPTRAGADACAVLAERGES